MRCSVSRERWKRISSFTSLAYCSPRNRTRRRCRSPRRMPVMSGPLEDACDGRQDVVELGDLLSEPAATAGGDGVVAGFASGRRVTPVRGDESLVEQPFERGVERALTDP